MQLELEFGVCALADYDEDGFAQIQTDSPGLNGSEGTQPAESLLPTGYYVRPLDPDRGPNNEIGLGAANLTITNGDRRYVMPLGDPRDVMEGRVPKLKKGGKMIAGGAGDYRSFLLFDGLDPDGEKKPGSVVLSASYAKNGVKKSLGLSFNIRDEGEEDISILHGDGARITINKDGTSITSPDGKQYTHIGNDGNVFAGDSKVQGSLVVGEQLAAQALVSGPQLIAFLTQLCTVVASITAVTPGAPAAALIPGLSAILTKHIKAT